MSNANNLEQVLSVLEPMSTEQVKVPSMPIGTFVQRAENLYLWAQTDKEVLLSKGLPKALLNDMPVRAGALREAESQWALEMNTRKDASKVWSEKAPKAYELKEDLIADFKYAFRHNEDLLKAVSAIQEGYGHDDMIQDLNDLSVLGKSNTTYLEKIGVDISLLDTAAAVSDEMANLLAQVTGDRNESNSAKKLRDKAYTHLKEAVDEIIACGRYAFKKQPGRRKGYKSPYTH